MPIQTVFLDAGGVLVNPNWSRVSETLGRSAGMTPALLDAADLSPGCDCLCVRSLTALVEALAAYRSP